MVTTKHCCYGVCRSDSHYGHREHMKGVGPNMHSGKASHGPRQMRALYKGVQTGKFWYRQGYQTYIHFLVVYSFILIKYEPLFL